MASRPMCVQVSPASSERYTPLPRITLERMPSEPVPTYTMEEFEGATRMDPMDPVAK